MIKEQHIFWPTPEGKRDSLNVLLKARSIGYIVWITIFYKIDCERQKFSGWVNNQTWNTVKKAIEYADRDIRIYDVCNNLDV